MMLSKTLARYLGRTYFANFMLILGVLLGVVYLFDTVELLRRAGKMGDVPFSLVMEMGLYKLPDVGQVVFPFAILFSAIFTFWQLTRRYELIVIRSAGLSVWQFLMPIAGVAFAMGLVLVTVINPVGSVFVSRFADLENKYLTRETNLVSVFDEGLWLRQDVDGGHVILHSGKINLKEWQLRDVMALFFSANDRFVQRVDAKSAVLEKGQWVFADAYVNHPPDISEHKAVYVLPTTLTRKEIEDSFSSPAAMSFWKLPHFIRMLETTGFDATPLRIHYHSLMAQPLLFAAMVLLAASVSLRPPRARGTLLLVAIGVFIGFLVFFLSSFLQAMGASQQIPVVLAAWALPVISMLLGTAMMLNLEDG